MGLKLAIVGRPNVGKSTLFNKLIGRKLAIVDDQPGVTRDRRIHQGKLHDLSFEVIDTAGLEEGDAVTLPGKMRMQTKYAVDEADIILFVFDARQGIIPLDLTFASLLRKSGKPIILVANKAESQQADTGVHEAWQLGFGSPCAISAEHGLGFANLRDMVVEQAAQLGLELDSKIEPKQSDAVRIAIVGRPNVGKSTFINSLLGEERLLTGEQAGVTRDSISINWDWRGHQLEIFDTAGLRRRARVEEKLEKLSVADTLKSIRFAHVVVIMFDATAAFEKQDLHIVDLVIKEGRVPVIAFNKWDLVEEPQKILNKLYEKLAASLPQVKGLRAVPVCAFQARGIDKLLENAIEVYNIWNKRIATGPLNRWLESVLVRHAAPLVKGRRLKIKYITQVKARPPSFVLYCSREDGLPDSYLRYITNSLREQFALWGVPIRIAVRSSVNPYINK
ncbi:ribosome biogenesis GTPase Der [Bartonella sp. TP]|uniref:ribosome biogenesis GTPase Der n=1 Tax=Bartonella sp. TP TaxID=3057550 RepID=UPI0025B27AD2|nr:ribosome biogenesis GTPase Der [Bartonella sp. TP]MDN5249437.1 ribosome biogenesis GTPase Der [Alphaproteobacteria bacterium]WJW80222.1 ribosome biogenesis GTPase Der [Bartonella sp. TP]